MPKLRSFTDAERQMRREKQDPKFRRTMKRQRAAQKHRRAVLMHIADRAAFQHGVQGAINYGGRVKFAFTGNYKNGSYNPTHAQPGLRVADGQLALELTGNRPSIPIGPEPGAMLLRAASLTEPHPIGLFAVPIKEQPGVFACMVAAKNKWVVTGFSLKGHAVPECVARGTTTLADIQSETNTEVQRLMIERFGHERFVRESGAEELQRDDFGTLYALPGGEKVVKVINSTVNPDGSANEYWIPVPRATASAHEAVAWSFGLTPAAYQPAAQS